MSGVATAIAGGAIIGAVVMDSSSRRAAATQSDAANRASDVSNAQYQQTREDQMPWRDAGVGALGQINSQMPDLTRKFSMSDFQADPGYQFRMDEGQKAIERSAAARGGLNSGATLKALSDYGQNTASSEYQNAYNRFTDNQNTRFNRLASVAGIGQNANAQIGAAGQNNANNISNNVMSAGNASAAGAIGQANAVNSAIGTGTNSWMQYQLMNRAFPSQTPGSTGTSYAPTSGSSGYLGANTTYTPYQP